MKLIIQIPALNEAETLPAVLASIPAGIDGIDVIEVLVIDDGSDDSTSDIAQSHGVDHIVRHAGRRGLARSFRDGVDRALALGADIVVNTDGDNQYPQARIPDLVRPIVAGRADIVIGDRQTRTIAHFSAWKKFLQAVGSRVVNLAAGTDLPDAASGFRAYSRDALLRLNLVTEFSYAMETIVQAGHKRLRIESVPIETNPKSRESRLFRHMGQHVFESAKAILRSYLMFRPLAFFLPMSVFLFVIALVPYIRYLVLTIIGEQGDHIQSLILGTAILVGSLLCAALGVVAELMRINRVLTEDLLERTKSIQFNR
jgi:glycosyltransferase involved in cell wall biosynthesis